MEVLGLWALRPYGVGAGSSGSPCIGMVGCRGGSRDFGVLIALCYILKCKEEDRKRFRLKVMYNSFCYSCLLCCELLATQAPTA